MIQSNKEDIIENFDNDNEQYVCVASGCCLPKEELVYSEYIREDGSVILNMPSGANPDVYYCGSSGLSANKPRGFKGLFQKNNRRRYYK